MKNKIKVLNTILMIVVMWLFCCQDCCARSNINKDRAAEYIRQAENCQKKADGCRRDALHHLRKALSYERWVTYYTKMGKVDKAETQCRYAEAARENYETMMENADEADDMAGDFLEKARRLIERNSNTSECGLKLGRGK